MRRLLPLLLLIAGCSRPHPGRVNLSALHEDYNRHQDKTYVYGPLGKIFSDPNSSVEADLTRGFAGRGRGKPEPTIRLYFFGHTEDDPHFESNHAVRLVADGSEISFRPEYRKKQAKGFWAEHINIDVPPETLDRLAKASTITGSIGRSPFRFDEKQLATIRGFAAYGRDPEMTGVKRTGFAPSEFDK